MLFASCQIFLGGSNQEDEMGRTCGMYGAEDKCVQGCGEECEGKRPFVRHRQRWVDDIKMDRKEVEWNRIYCERRSHTIFSLCSQWNGTHEQDSKFKVVKLDHFVYLYHILTRVGWMVRSLGHLPAKVRRYQFFVQQHRLEKLSHTSNLYCFMNYLKR